MESNVRQYVGARYVPQFADPVGWKENTSYEALTIVTYNNASYTSKVPVPPTVGNPADNQKYWALTGNYNAQVESYRKDVQKLNRLFISPTKFGAIGDGITDDTKAFEEAYNFAVKNNGVVYVPYGTFNVSNLETGDCPTIIDGIINGNVTFNGYVDGEIKRLFTDNSSVTITRGQNVYVEWFGAKLTNDNTIESSGAINRAITALKNSGNVIFQPSENNQTVTLPYYNYYLTTSIKLNKSNIHLIGNNTSFTCRGCNFIDINSNTYLEEISINDFVVYGNHGNTEDSRTYGIKISPSVNIARIDVNNVLAFEFDTGFYFNHTTNLRLNYCQAYVTKKITLTPIGFHSYGGANASLRLFNCHATSPEYPQTMTGFLFEQNNIKDFAMLQCEVAFCNIGIYINNPNGTTPSEAYDAFISNCIIDGSNKPILVENYFSGTQLNITNNWINQYCNDSTAIIEVNSSEMINISNNEIRTTNNPDATAFIINNGSKLLISSNTIGCGHIIDTNNTKNLNLSNNISSGSFYYSPSTINYKQSLMQSTTNSVVIGNIFDTPGAGIFIDGNSSGNKVVYNNLPVNVTDEGSNNTVIN